MMAKHAARLNLPDYALMRKCNNWLAPRWVRIAMVGATRMGDGWLWAGIVLLILMFGDGSRWQVAGAAVTAMLSSVLVFMGLKRLVSRKRPCDIEPHCWADLLPPDQFSFPSGHTMTAMAFALSLGYFYSIALVFVLPLAVVIGISRIVLGMHFLSDVLVGALLGGSLGYTCALLFL